ncbi:MAG: prepilin-type N-terminal cleavage/methylation domain-containing protein [Deltaproteobacteria bacterium]|nr:prepilin-type N-terminal cleavage/methylation domain-containing protein [Deltaproteobacteria bacterium]
MHPARLLTTRLKKHKTNQGFTLIEMLVAIGILGVLAAIAAMAYNNYREKAKLGVIATDLRTFGISFEGYRSFNGCYPPDSHNDAPYNLKPGYGTEDYLPIGAWINPPSWGGFYNWEGPDIYTYAGISLFGTSASNSTMLRLDKIMDDGSLSTGNFQQTPNNRYTYIVNANTTAADACP